MGNIYDGAFRTILNDCRQMIIPVINEIFKEDYTGNEKIEFHPNEHFIGQQDVADKERITDTNFVIYGRKKKKYHLECQSSTDNSMLVRFFEYDTQIALDEGQINRNILTVTLPHSAVLFLRHHASTPDTLKIRMITPGGTVEYDIQVMKSQQYTLEEIFEKNLLLLIPFYIFSHETRFDEYERDKAKLKALQEEYEWIKNKLEELLKQRAISEYTRCTIIDMSNKVLEHIAVKYNSVKEGVKAVMGGKVLEYEAKTIKREGIKEGIQKGIQEGIQEGENKLSTLITKLIEHNRPQDIIKATQDKQYRNKLYEEYHIGK